MDSVVQQMGRFVLENPEVVHNLDRIINYNDEPQLYQYTSQFVDGNSKRATEDSTASGTSFNKNSALLKLLGETIERYSLGTYDSKTLVQSSYNKLVSDGKNSLDPAKLSLFPKLLKNSNRKIGDIKFSWMMGKSLIANRGILVPAQLVFTPYRHTKNEPILRMQISTGAAAGETIYDAMYRGICEAIERDSFMIHYYNKISSPRIDLHALKSTKITRMISVLKRYNLELCVNDITTDLGVPVVVALVLDRTGMGPAVCVGLKAGYDISQNVIGATEEALMVRTWVRDEYMYSKSSIKLPKVISTIEDRARFWCPLETISYLDFWINAKAKISQHKLYSRRQDTYKAKIDALVKILRLKGYEIVSVDITAPKVRKYGVKVVKMIIPRLQPLYLDEKYSHFTLPRLRDAPVAMGVLSKPLKLNELNPIPHPFL